MRIKNVFLTSLFIIFLIGSAYDVSAQNIFEANVKKSDLKVTGTSTLHDWYMDTDNFGCVIKALNEKNKLIIQNVNFTCNTNSLKSENSLMDKKAWEALKIKDFKTIYFNSDEQVEFILIKGKVEGEIAGELFLIGQEKRVSIPFKGEFDEFGSLILKGEIKVKMSEFGIIPPTALLGSIKTGDEITIVYNLNLNQTTIISAN